MNNSSSFYFHFVTWVVGWMSDYVLLCVDMSALSCACCLLPVHVLLMHADTCVCTHGVFSCICVDANAGVYICTCKS